MAPVPGRALLTRVITRVHAAAQSSRSREEYELGSITLRLLALLRQGREATLDLACFEAHGLYFAKWRQRSMERSSMMAWEFQRLIPDFDPAEARHAQMEQSRQVRGRGESGRAVFESEKPREARPAKPQLMPRVPERPARKNA